MRQSGIYLFICLIFTVYGPGVYGENIDEETGLIIDLHWQTVKNNCTVCHSAKIITNQRGNRETWKNIIRWMQDTQGLWEFDEYTEKAILDYLAKNYPPVSSHRRLPISDELMPDNQ